MTSATRTLHVDGIDIATRTWGDGSSAPLVLVHGGGAHSRWWDHIAPLLAQGRHVVALDLAGHGDSGRRAAYSFDTWADDVQAVAEDVGGQAIVVGHSLGGMVCARLAERAPSVMGGLVLLDSILGARTADPSDRSSSIASTPTRRYETEEQAIARWRPVPLQGCPPWVRQHVAETSVRRYEDGWSWKFDHRVFAEEITSPLPRQPIPQRSAFFRAEHGLVGEAAARRTAAALGSTITVTVPDAGHHLMLDQPLALVTALRVLLSAWSA